MQRNVIFGGNLICRMAENIFWQGIKFGRLKHEIEYEIYINAFFIKKLYFLLTTRIIKKKKNINLARINFGGW